jgi:hypothetical protein
MTKYANNVTPKLSTEWYREQRRLEAALRDEYVPKIEAALRAAGLHVQIGGCGCCGSPQLDVEGIDVTVEQIEIDSTVGD